MLMLLRDAEQEITSQKGIFGIWDGFFPWGTVQALAKGAVFGWAHALAKNTLMPYADQGYISQGVAEVLAGGIGGGFQGLVLSPTLLLKTRVMTDPVFRTKYESTLTMLASVCACIIMILAMGDAGWACGRPPCKALAWE